MANLLEILKQRGETQRAAIRRMNENTDSLHELAGEGSQGMLEVA